jgi:hypothetical protein
MDEGTIGLIILVSINIVLSLIVHSFYKNKVNASLISGLLSIVIFLLLDSIVNGSDKFIMIAFFVGGFISILISLALGEIFYQIKKRMRE